MRIDQIKEADVMSDKAADEVLGGTEPFEGRGGEEGTEVVVLDFFVAHGDEVPPGTFVG